MEVKVEMILNLTGYPDGTDDEPALELGLATWIDERLTQPPMCPFGAFEVLEIDAEVRS